MKYKAHLSDPYTMAAGIFILLLLVYFAVYLGSLIFGFELDQKEIWMYICSAYMVYAIYGSINVLLSPSLEKYYIKTFLAFGVMVIVGLAVGWWISGLNIYYITSYWRVLISVLLSFVLFMSVAGVASHAVNWTREIGDRPMNHNREHKNRDH